MTASWSGCIDRALATAAGMSSWPPTVCVASLATPVTADILIVSTQGPVTPFSVAASSQALGSVVPFYNLTDGLVFDDAPARLTFILPADTAEPLALAIYTFDGVEWTSAAITNQSIILLADADRGGVIVPPVVPAAEVTR